MPPFPRGAPVKLAVYLVRKKEMESDASTSSTLTIIFTLPFRPRS